AQAGLDGVGGATIDEAEGVVNVAIISDEQLTAVVGLLGERGFAIAGIDTHLPSLDEVFLAITGQKTSLADADADADADGGADADDRARERAGAAV
ncbi:hypothetical protein ADK38_38590, partial [Streptomyces varsoviensis]